MHFKTHLFFLPALFVASGVLAQLSAVATSYTPDVTFPGPTDWFVDSFVFCSGQDCTGTCEVESVANIPADDAHVAPNDMGYTSMYWYDPGGYRWDLYTCLSAGCGGAAQIGPNTCYNLYDNGVLTDYYVYYYYVQGGKM